MFVEAGSPDRNLAWQELDGDRWNFVDDVMFHTEVFTSKPQKVTESAPLILESTLLRRQINGIHRLRVGIRYSTQDDLREGKVVFTDEFTLGGK